MLTSAPTTIPAEVRDYPEWHRGRQTYAVWIVPVEDECLTETFHAARKHLSEYLLEPYRRQPHITLFVCGFLVEDSQYDDDFLLPDLQSQMRAFEEARSPTFEIEIGRLNSFTSAPYLEVHDSMGQIARLREVLRRGAREFRTAPYVPHLTVGLYSSAFSSEEVTRRLREFAGKPVRFKVEQIALATYQAQEFAGPLLYRYNLRLENKR